MDVRLLDKTELRIYGLELKQVNLTAVAAAVAAVLGLPPAQTLVVDVRPDHICLDILAQSVELTQIIGKQKELLAALAQLEGVAVRADAYIDSHGILGMIGYDQPDAAEMVSRTKCAMDEVEWRILRRAIVFATGFEVHDRMIEDTNSPYLVEVLSRQGYQAEFGGTLEDDVAVIAFHLRDAVERGFGLIVTTGGVGAEQKDCSIEALLSLDPQAATPWTVHFKAGTGRHVKAGVRIGVGQYGLSTLISLPGPHDEVIAAATALEKHCKAGRIDNAALAAEIAEILRAKLAGKHLHHAHA